MLYMLQLMKCPYCGYQDSKVIDSRSIGAGIRRRRQCLHCSSRFTTYERVHADSFLVIKKDGRREEFNRDKLTGGIHKACAKRPVSNEAIERVVDEIEKELHQLGKGELPSSLIGELVMERLRELDRIAFIRFASVYREFADIETFREEVDALVVREAAPCPAQLPLFSRGGSRISPEGRGDYV
jgi:transcriptional repressor NrdR